VIVALMQIDVRARESRQHTDAARAQGRCCLCRRPGADKVIAADRSAGEFMATPYQALMPIFAAEVFRGERTHAGFLIGAAGFGGSSGLIYLAARKDVRGLALHIVIARRSPA